jgi:tetratricopeptide (TPR) repeat protein
MVGRSPHAYVLLANYYRKQGNLALAARVCVDALRQHPQYAPLHRTLAGIRFEQGRQNEADKLLRDAPATSSAPSGEIVVTPREPSPCKRDDNDVRQICRYRIRIDRADSRRELNTSTELALRTWRQRGEPSCEKGEEHCYPWGEVLLRVAEAYDTLGKVGMSISLYQTLLLPRLNLERSDAAPRALAALAKLHLGMGIYDMAAKWQEAYVTRYPKQQDAPALLATAIELRDLLGQQEQASALRDQARKLYGDKMPSVLESALQEPDGADRTPPVQRQPQERFAAQDPLRLLFPSYVPPKR